MEIKKARLWFRGLSCLTVMVLLCALSACGEQEEVIVEPTFTSIQDKVLNDRCVGCHGAANGNEADLNLESYAAVTADTDIVNPGDPESSLLYTQVRDGIMPPFSGKLGDSAINAIKTWIEDGAPNN